MRPLLNSQNKCLIDLLRTCERHRTLQEKVNLYLPTHDRAHCQVGGFKKNCLTLVVSSAARLTFLKPMELLLKKQLRQDVLPGLRQIKWKIAVPNQSAYPMREPGLYIERHLSPSAAACLRQSAENTSNVKIKAALQRLAQAYARA